MPIKHNKELVKRLQDIRSKLSELNNLQAPVKDVAEQLDLTVKALLDLVEFMISS